MQLLKYSYNLFLNLNINSYFKKTSIDCYRPYVSFLTKLKSYAHFSIQNCQYQLPQKMLFTIDLGMNNCVYFNKKKSLLNLKKKNIFLQNTTFLKVVKIISNKKK